MSKKHLDDINKTKEKTYVVQKGNSPWQIAHDNGITLDEFYKLNPKVKERHMIHPGDVVRLKPDEIVEEINIREERNREKIANIDNISAIQSVNHDSNYVIVDKKNKQLVVYDKNNTPIYSTNEISTGLSGNDYNTITYTKNGRLINNAGNNSTPAGITTIKNVGLYHGSPSFIRERINKDGTFEDIASSIHLGNTKNRLSSNGCIRASADTLENLSKLIGAGTKVYTLPEQEGSKFTVRGGKLNFTADNPVGKTEGDKKYWDDYNTYIDKSYAPLKLTWVTTGDEKYDNNRKAFANTLTNNKELIQNLFNLSSDEYNRLAELALGIAEQESKFGTSRRYSLKQGIGSPIIDMIRGNARSRGMTQIKMRTDNKQMQDYYASQGIDEESINNAEQSAMATIGRLAGMYRDEVRGRKFIGANGIEISPEEALLYKWNGHNEELKNNTATPEQNIYIQNVRKYSNNFEMYEPRTRYIYKEGGSINDTMGRKKHLDGGGYDPRKPYHPIYNHPATGALHPISEDYVSYIPIVGTTLDVMNAVDNPTAKNIIQAGVSAGLDALGPIIGGVIKGAKPITKTIPGGYRFVRTGVRKKAWKYVPAKTVTYNTPKQIAENMAYFNLGTAPLEVISNTFLDDNKTKNNNIRQEYKLGGKKRYLDDNPPYATYQQSVDDGVLVPYNPDFISTYNLPEVSVAASSLPKAKATDANIERYANAVANGDIKLTQIPDAKLRNAVRAKPIVDKISEDTDKAAMQVGLPLLAFAAAPMIGSVIGGEVLGTAGRYVLKGMDAMGKPFGTTAKVLSKLGKIPPKGKFYRLAKMADALYDIDLTAKGIKDLATDNGIQKTIRLAKEGDTWGAIKSGTNDLFNLTGVLGLGNDIRNIKQISKEVKKFVNAPKRYKELSQKYIDLRDEAYNKYNTFINAQYKVNQRSHNYKDKINKLEDDLENLVYKSDPTAPYYSYGNYSPKVNFSRMTPENRIKYGEKLKKEFGASGVHLDNDGNLHLSGVDLTNRNNVGVDIDFGKQGDYDIIDFATGQHHKGNVSNIEGSNKLETVIIGAHNPGRSGIELVSGSNYKLKVPETKGDLSKVLSGNIKYVQDKIPGFKPFGSSVGAAEGGIHHVTHDIDGYMTYEDFMQYAKTNPVMRRPLGSAADNVTYDQLVAEWNRGIDGSNNTYMAMMGDGKFGNQGNVDINVINIGKDGSANARTVEVYRQFFPEAYRKQIIEQALNPNDLKHIKILDESGNVMTNKQLLDAVDPLKKTILDSMEIDWNAPEKRKHAGRFIGYMLGDKPSAIHEALDSTSKIQFGKKAKLLPKFDFGDITKNESDILSTLKELGYNDNVAEAIVSKAKQTNNPQYLQNAVDYWYITESKFQRLTNAGDINEVGGTIEKLNRNTTIWNPNAGGGNARVPGLNSTRGKWSAHGSKGINALIQPAVSNIREGQSFNEGINQVLRQNFLKGKISAEEASKLNKIGVNVKEDDSLLSVINKLSTDDKATAKQVTDILGINGITGGDTYMGSNTGVVTGLRDLTNPEDAIGLNPGGIASGIDIDVYKGVPMLSDRMAAIGTTGKKQYRLRGLVTRYPSMAMPYHRKIDDLRELQKNAENIQHKLYKKASAKYKNYLAYDNKRFNMDHKASQADYEIREAKDLAIKLAAINAATFGSVEAINYLTDNKSKLRLRRRLDSNGNKSK